METEMVMYRTQHGWVSIVCFVLTQSVLCYLKAHQGIANLTCNTAVDDEAVCLGYAGYALFCSSWKCDITMKSRASIPDCPLSGC